MPGKSQRQWIVKPRKRFTPLKVYRFGAEMLADLLDKRC